MSLTDSLKNGACFVADTASEIAESIAEKNRLRAQLNHLKKLIKSDSATRDSIGTRHRRRQRRRFR